MADGNFGGGNGSVESPYLVEDAADLNAVRNNRTAHYLQVADIDLSGYENWDPIGSMSLRFSGSYDGGSFFIDNLTINRPTIEGVGLFAFLSDIRILRKINLRNVNITGDYRVGALVGYSHGKIYDCSSSGVVIGRHMVGGLAGSLHEDYAVLERCSSSCSVSAIGGHTVGGLTGYNYGTISECFSTGDVSSDTSKAGGLVGFNYGTIINCYSRSGVLCTGATLPPHVTRLSAGGLVGDLYSQRGKVEKSYSTGYIDVLPRFTDVGGLVGEKDYYSSVADSYYDYQTSGQSDTGKGIPKTTAEMKQQITFTDWNFEEIWRIDEEINDGYPYLLCFYEEEEPPPTKYEITFTVTGSPPIENAKITIGKEVKYTDADGQVAFNLEGGEHTYLVEAGRYWPKVGIVEVVDEPVAVAVQLRPAVPRILTWEIKSASPYVYLWLPAIGEDELPGDPGLHFRLQAYADPLMKELIYEADSRDEPIQSGLNKFHFKQYSTRQFGAPPENLPVGIIDWRNVSRSFGLNQDITNYRAFHFLLRTRLEIGPRRKVWLRVGIAALNE